MAEVKWIKIVTNIFDDEKIRYIETLPSGDEMIVIWFKILCLAGRSNSSGLLMMTDRIAYTDQMLSSIFSKDIKTIQLALSVFQNLEMIEMIDNRIYLLNWEKHQNVIGLDKIREDTRKRVARHRENKLIEANVVTCAYCGGKATGFDHIEAISRGGKDDDKNKIPCCIRCNRIKNDKPIVDFLNNNRNIIDDNLITSNPKLKKFVYLCNVTNRYNVTQRNATELELDIDKEIEEDKEKNKDTLPSVASVIKPPINSFASVINEYTTNDNLRETLKNYKDMRVKMSKGFSTNSMKLILNKLSKLSSDDDTKIAIVNQSIENTWKGIFELKTDLPKKNFNNYSRKEIETESDQLAKQRELVERLTNGNY